MGAGDGGGVKGQVIITTISTRCMIPRIYSVESEVESEVESRILLAKDFFCCTGIPPCTGSTLLEATFSANCVYPLW